MKFKKLCFSAAAGLLMLSGCFGSKTDTALQVTKEKVYELGDKVILTPETFLEPGVDQTILKDITIESALMSDPAYEYTGFTHEVKTSGSEYLMPGTYNIDLKYNGEVYPVVLRVRDTVAPTFISAPRKMIVQQGDSGFDLASKFKADDHDEVTITYKGEFDVNTPGEYAITIIATDKSGNSNELPITLKVIGQNEIVDTSESAEDILILDSNSKEETKPEPTESEDKTETTEPEQTTPEPEKPEQPACGVSGIPAGAVVYHSFEEMIAAGTAWNSQNPNNYFFYTAGKDDCGNDVYMLTMATNDSGNPMPGTDAILEKHGLKDDQKKSDDNSKDTANTDKQSSDKQ